MADDDTGAGAIENGNDAPFDPSTGDAHSAFLDDEELNEQIPDEFDADDRTALTAAHQGSDPHGAAVDTAAGRTSLFAEDPLDPAFIQPNAGPLSATSPADGLPAGDSPYGDAPFGSDANANPADALSAPSLLNGDTPEDFNTDDQPSLVAAHQGARATSLPLDQAAAFNPGAQADLFGDLGAAANAAGNAAGGSSSDVLSGNPGADNLGDLGLDISGPDANAPQGAESGGRSTAAAADNGGDVLGGLQLDGGDADPAGSGLAASNNAANGSSPPDIAPLADFGSGPGSSDDGLGGSGDQGAQPGTGGGGDDVQEYIAGDTTSTDSGVTGGGGGGGVNPIIGDKFDNNLTGTDGRDMINAQDGNDIAFGGAGDDLIMGKKGDDTLQGGLGDDVLKGGHGDDTFVFTNADFDGNAWTDVVDGQGQGGNPASDYDTIDLTGVTQGWTLEVDGAGAGAEATNATSPTDYTEGGGEFSGTITFDDGSTISFDHIEKIDW